MKENYALALKQVLKYEGGKVDDPRDPGGRTAYGVTQDTYNAWRKKQGLPNADVFTISQTEVAAIYKYEYWDAIRGDDLPSGVDFAVFDYAVNSGVSKAAKTLQGVVGVAQDGQIGPQTIQAAKDYVAMAVTNKRLAFMQSLSIWSTFGKGWSARIADVKNQILALTKQETKMNWIVTRLKQGSTWSGIAAIVAGASFIPHADEISKLIPSVGAVVAGALAIWFP